MSVQAALRFIGQARQDDSLKKKVAALGHTAGLEDLLALGAEAGLAFTGEELQRAFRHDWAMRWARYGGAQAEDGKAPPPIVSA